MYKLIDSQFSTLRYDLENQTLDLNLIPTKTKLGTLNIAELYSKEKGLKKAELVSDSKLKGVPMVLKLESILPENNITPIHSISIQVFDDGQDGINYGGRISIRNNAHINSIDDLANAFFDDFQENSNIIYQKYGDLIYDVNPNSTLLDKILIAMTAKFPKEIPNISLYRF